MPSSCDWRTPGKALPDYRWLMAEMNEHQADETVLVAGTGDDVCSTSGCPGRCPAARRLLLHTGGSPGRNWAGSAPVHSGELESSLWLAQGRTMVTASFVSNAAYFFFFISAQQPSWHLKSLFSHDSAWNWRSFRAYSKYLQYFTPVISANSLNAVKQRKAHFWEMLMPLIKLIFNPIILKLWDIHTDCKVNCILQVGFLCKQQSMYTAGNVRDWLWSKPIFFSSSNSNYEMFGKFIYAASTRHVSHTTKVVFYNKIVNFIIILGNCKSTSKKKQAHIYRRGKSGYISLKKN